MAKSGKSESARTNTGNAGGRKTQLTELQKILMGGGVLRNVGKPNAGRKVRTQPDG